MAIEKTMVVGAGTMGAGIAQLFAQNEIPVVLTDLNEEMVVRAIGGLEARAAKRVEQGKMSAEAKDAVFSRITPATGYAKAADADVVVEAVFEDMDIKKEVLAALDEAAPERAIFASNTTSLSITEMAAATSRPEKVVGVHFFNPPLVMKLVEIMPGLGTSKETVEAARALAERLGKTPVMANFDSPAGIGSRVLAGMLNEAVEVYAGGPRVRRGHRQGDEDGRGPAHGAARTHRPDRRGHPPRQDGDALPRAGRYALPAQLPVAQDGQGGSPRPKVRPRLLHLRIKLHILRKQWILNSTKPSV